jgi:hypothetical protein
MLLLRREPALMGPGPDGIAQPSAAQPSAAQSAVTGSRGLLTPSAAHD